MRQSGGEIELGTEEWSTYGKSTSVERDVSSRSLKYSVKTLEKNVEFLVSDAELAFSWNRINLRMLGLWPDQTCNDNFVTRCRSLMWGLIVFCFVVGPQALAPIAYHFVLSDLTELISSVTGLAAGLFKIVVLWYNGEALAWCLTSVSNDWTRKISFDDRETMIKNARFGRRISIGVTIFVQGLVWSYVLLQAFSLINLKFEAQNSTDFGRRLFYPSYFPFDLSKRFNFAIAWCGQCIGLICCGLAYSGTDGFVAIIVIHLCGQIAILRRSLLHMIDDDAPVSADLFQTRLRFIVQRHQTLIRFGNVVKDTVSWLLLVLIIACTVPIGLQLFRLMTVVTERKTGHFPFLQVVSLLSFLNATLCHLFVYCYVGDMLIGESEAFEMASYFCRWYNLSGKCAMDVKLVMCRANVPLQILAGKFVPFSLELFGNVLKTSLSYFSVLLTMKEQTAE